MGESGRRLVKRCYINLTRKVLHLDPRKGNLILGSHGEVTSIIFTKNCRVLRDGWRGRNGCGTGVMGRGGSHTSIGGWGFRGVGGGGGSVLRRISSGRWTHYLSLTRHGFETGKLCF